VAKVLETDWKVTAAMVNRVFYAARSFSVCGPAARQTTRLRP